MFAELTIRKRRARAHLSFELHPHLAVIITSSCLAIDAIFYRKRFPPSKPDEDFPVTVVLRNNLASMDTHIDYS